MPANPIVIDEAPDLPNPKEPRPPSRADDTRHRIDELQRALRVERDKNKDLLRQKKRLIRQNRSLLDTQKRDGTREHWRQREIYEAERQDWLQQRESFDRLVREKKQAEARGCQLGNKLTTAEMTIRLLQDRQIPECPICQDAMCCGVIQCGHQFCVSCFDRWYREQGAKGATHSCPTCRASLHGPNGPIFIKMHGIRQNVIQSRAI